MGKRSIEKCLVPPRPGCDEGAPASSVNGRATQALQRRDGAPVTAVADALVIDDGNALVDQLAELAVQLYLQGKLPRSVGPPDANDAGT